MTAFLIVFFVLLYMMCKGLPEQRAQTKFLYVASFVLVIISGLRHEAVGNDTYAYILNYNNSINTSWNEILTGFFDNYLNPEANRVKDPGYKIFEKLACIVLPSARLYLIFIALLMIPTVGKFIKAYTRSLNTTLFIYVFYVTLFFGYLPNSAIRQSLALSCVLYANCIFINGGGRRKSLLCALAMVILGSVFHKSALIAISLFFLFRVKDVRIVYVLAFFAFVFMLLFSSSIASFFAESSGEIYAGYLSRGYYGASGGKPVAIVFLVAVLFGICFWGMRYDNYVEENRLYYYGAALTLIFVPLTMVNPSLIRIMSYFAFFMGGLVCDSLNRIPRGNLYKVGLILVFFVHSVKSGNDYHFMWEEMKLHERYGRLENTREKNDFLVLIDVKYNENQ